MRVAGTKFDMLTAVTLIKREDAPSKKKYKISLWRWKCDCGSIIEEYWDKVRNKKHASCGCTPLTWAKMGRKPLPYGKSSLNHLLSTYLRGAKKRNLEFNLSEDDFKELTLADCHYCGCPPSRIHLAVRGVNGHYKYNGLDRVDNNKGYTKDNVVTCCKVCNYAKRNSSIEEFLEWLNRVKNRG